MGLKIKVDIESVEKRVQELENRINKMMESLEEIEEISDYNEENIQELKEMQEDYNCDCCCEECSCDEDFETVEDLYKEATNVLNRINQPTVQFDVDIVDFLNIVKCQHDWDKLILGIEYVEDFDPVEEYFDIQGVINELFKGCDECFIDTLKDYLKMAYDFGYMDAVDEESHEIITSPRISLNTEDIECAMESLLKIIQDTSKINVLS